MVSELTVASSSSPSPIGAIYITPRCKDRKTLSYLCLLVCIRGKTLLSDLQMDANRTNPEDDPDGTALNELSERIIGCVFTVANTLLTGFREKVRENALAHDLRKAGWRSPGNNLCGSYGVIC